jgi:hypothetical protein
MPSFLYHLTKSNLSHLILLTFSWKSGIKLFSLKGQPLSYIMHLEMLRNIDTGVDAVQNARDDINGIE